MEQDTSYETRRSEHEYSVADLLRILRRRSWVVILITVLFTGAAVGFGLLQTPTYQASTKILIGQTGGKVQPGTLGSDVQGLQQITQTMVEAIDSRSVAGEVIRRLDLRISPDDFLKKHLGVEQISTTQFIRVTYEASDPRQAQRVANTIGEVFSDQVSGISASNGAITATVWERANIPENPISPNLPLDFGVGLALGLLLGVGLAFLLDFFDDSWRSPEELERVSRVPNLGMIPKFEVLKGDPLRKRTLELEAEGQNTPVSQGTEAGRKSNKAGKDSLHGNMVTLLAPNSAASEAFRSLRTNLSYAFFDSPPRIIMVTSPGSQAGKSTVCANLGIALAQAGKRTLILDCDLHKPMIHKVFGLRNLLGLVNVLVKEHSVQKVWHELLPNLKVVTTGPMPPNPAELLGSKRLSELLDENRENFDYILLDTPPVGVVSDPAMLAAQVDGVFLIVDAQGTRKRVVQRSMRSLEIVEANVLGTVMNNVKFSRGDERHYAYVYR